jgi:hypothetical protein
MTRYRQDLENEARRAEMGKFLGMATRFIKAIWPNMIGKMGPKPADSGRFSLELESVDLTPCVVFKFETFLKRRQAHRPRTVPRIRAGWRSDHIGGCVHCSLDSHHVASYLICVMSARQYCHHF